jgi:hypothetical protein
MISQYLLGIWLQNVIWNDVLLQLPAWLRTRTNSDFSLLLHPEKTFRALFVGPLTRTGCLKVTGVLASIVTIDISP